MKKIFRHFVIDTFSLYLTSIIASGLVFEKGILTILLAGAAVTVASFVAKPVITLLLLPINLVTFGLFKWLSSGIVLFLVTLIITDFKIVEFAFNGLSTEWFDIPALSFVGIFAYVSFSFLFSFISSIIHWVAK